MFRQFIFVMYFIRLANDFTGRRPEARNAGSGLLGAGASAMKKATAMGGGFEWGGAAAAQLRGSGVMPPRVAGLVGILDHASPALTQQS